MRPSPRAGSYPGHASSSPPSASSPPRVVIPAKAGIQKTEREDGSAASGRVAQLVEQRTDNKPCFIGLLRRRLTFTVQCR
jgi:hypothetical protein